MENKFKVGHSYIRRLQQYCYGMSFKENMNLMLSRFEVKFITHTSSNRKISKMSDLAQELHSVYLWGQTIDVLFLDLSSNDLNNHSDNDPIQTADYFIGLAESLIQMGVRQVILGELMYRSGSGAVCRNQPQDMDWYEAETAFNARAHEFNSYIKLRLSTMFQSQIVFLHQKGLFTNWRDHMCPDGVHLKLESMERYFRNVRGAILHSSNLIRGENNWASVPFE